MPSYFCHLDFGLGALPSGQGYLHLDPPCPFGWGLGPPASPLATYERFKPTSPDPGPVLTLTITRGSGSSRYEKKTKTKLKLCCFHNISLCHCNPGQVFPDIFLSTLSLVFPVCGCQSWAGFSPSACFVLYLAPFLVPLLFWGLREWRHGLRKATIRLRRGRQVSCSGWLLNHLLLAYLGICTYSLAVTGQRTDP